MPDTPAKTKARLPRGFVDRSPQDIRATERMMEKIREVYDRYGFEPVETPLIEYTDALGKFLPDVDRPNEGVFAWQDDDETWLALRYDLTAPLARVFVQIEELLGDVVALVADDRRARVPFADDQPMVTEHDAA